MKHSKEELAQALTDAWNWSEVCRSLGYKASGTTTKHRLKKLAATFGLDITHLKKTPRPRFIYTAIEKTCPVCETKFITKENHPREQTTCSYSCSNTFFRSGANHPKFIDGTNCRSRSARKIAFRAKEAVCECCGWDKSIRFLHVHHIDRDRTNNWLDNLKILCIACHHYKHYLAKDGWYYRNR